MANNVLAPPSTNALSAGYMPPRNKKNHRQQLLRKQSYGKREDGSLKGSGWLGLVPRKDGGVSTELSMGIEMDGREVLMPLMVPTLTQGELDYLVNDHRQGMEVPETIRRKSIDHGIMQMRKGQSPFFD